MLASIGNDYIDTDAISNIRAVPGPHGIQQDLGGQLSPEAKVYYPGNPGYTTATTRWSAASHPEFLVVVVPATDQDVVVAVKYANKNKIPFLAVNRGHGTSIDMNNLRYGINIYVRNLDNITIAPNGHSAILGGGVYSDQLIQTLALKGKTAATGACTCVGVVGAGLGGGLGRYQGLFGLVADNFLEMTVITASGAIHTVSENRNADLFWAMRGAGHNFGIVTSFEYKINDSIPSWYIATYIYTKEKLEAVFSALNDQNDNSNQPKELTTYTVFAFDPNISAEPVIIVSLWYAGPAASAHPYTLPFLALNPRLTTKNDSIPYPSLADAVGTGINSPICKPGLSVNIFPTGILKFNLSTNRQVYNLYAELVTQHPGFAGSVVQFEAYSMLGIRSVKAESTASSFLARYPPSSSDDDIAPLYGHQFRTLFHNGDTPARSSFQRPLNTYINHAYGDESMEMMYGYEKWRLGKLKKLKREWDPRGAFGWFHPIR
ncbi:MAG: hypothetical protein Q9223_006341 [Gallowayella weberi]